MFGIFKKKTQSEKLLKKYDELVKQAYELSKTNRIESDKKVAEAETILKEIEKLEKQEQQ